jgi:hypothetical protein
LVAELLRHSAAAATVAAAAELLDGAPDRRGTQSAY